MIEVTPLSAHTPGLTMAHKLIQRLVFMLLALTATSLVVDAQSQETTASPTTERPVRPTKSAAPPRESASAPQSPTPAPVKNVETQVEAGSLSALLRIQRIQGVTARPGMSFYFPSGDPVTPETADAILFEFNSSGAPLSAGEVDIELQDQDGNVLSSFPTLARKNLILILLRSPKRSVGLPLSPRAQDLSPMSSIPGG
jgi:hypothetical protein